MIDFLQLPWQWQLLSPWRLDAVLQLHTRSMKSFDCAPSLNFLARSPWNSSLRFWNLLQDIWTCSQERPCFRRNLFSITWTGSAQDLVYFTQKNTERRRCALSALFSFWVAFVIAEVAWAKDTLSCNELFQHMSNS